MHWRRGMRGGQEGERVAHLDFVFDEGALHEKIGQPLVLHEFAHRRDAHDHLLGRGGVGGGDLVASALFDHLLAQPAVRAALATLLLFERYGREPC